MDQQPQEQKKDGVFVEYKILKDIKEGTSDSGAFSLIIFLTSIIGIVVINNIIAQILFVIIIILSIFVLASLGGIVNILDNITPKKVKKIIKETIIYEDGSTEEYEEKYEC